MNDSDGGLSFMQQMCKHEGAMPDNKDPFDPKVARDMTVAEIHARWPRKQCQKCNAIIYESYEHYIMGDW